MTDEPQRFHQAALEETVAAIVMRRIESRLDEIAHSAKNVETQLGWSRHDERGQLIGDGVIGDLARLSARVDQRLMRDDFLISTWRNRVVGASFALTLAGAIIWWLIKSKLGDILQ